MGDGPGNHNRDVGMAGEEVAVGFLQSRRFRILERNFRCRGGEVDIIARSGKTIVFVEVKTRSNERFGSPAQSVTLFKQRQIARAAQIWLALNHLQDQPARFDVVAILLGSGGVPRIEHLVDAFELPA
jgi:putative endonuclease